MSVNTSDIVALWGGSVLLSHPSVTLYAKPHTKQDEHSALQISIMPLLCLHCI